jgi:hypothetical protein
MKFSKPGKAKKTSKIKNKSSRRHDIAKPKILKCCRCKKETDTIRLVHYEGIYKHKYGKGTGLKVNDNLISLLCNDCDIIMSTKPDKGNII